MHHRSVVTNVPGRWFAAAIEYVESGISIAKSDLLSRHRDRSLVRRRGLKYLVNSFHAKNLLHCDLRDENIISKGEYAGSTSFPPN